MRAWLRTSNDPLVIDNPSGLTPVIIFNLTE